jgi:hypothetical protein
MYAIINIANRRWETPDNVMYTTTLERAQELLKELEEAGLQGSSDWSHVIVPLENMDDPVTSIDYYLGVADLELCADEVKVKQKVSSAQEKTIHLGSVMVRKLGEGELIVRDHWYPVNRPEDIPRAQVTVMGIERDNVAKGLIAEAERVGAELNNKFQRVEENITRWQPRP